MSIREIWEQYKRQRDGDHFTDHASFVFVPTTSGAIGYDAVRQFLSTAYDPRALKIKENVIFQTIGEDSIVEESETTINFVNGEGVWLVPGVDSRYTIDNQVVIPTVTSAKFEGDRISSIRVYWDQASVLKQLKLIGDKNSWPIVTNRQADAVRDIASAHLNPFGRADRLAAGVARMNLNQQEPRRPVHTSSRVNQPGGTGGKSSIFGDNDAYDERQQEALPGRRPVHTSSRVSQPGGTGGKSSVFGDNDTYDENTSNIEQQQEPPHGRRPVHTSSRVNQPGGTGGKSSVFGDSDTYDENTNKQQRSSRFNSNKNVSQFSIGDDVNETQQDNVSISGSSKRRGKSQFESSVEFGDDGNQQRPSIKPSSRVLRPPGGGGSQFTFG